MVAKFLLFVVIAYFRHDEEPTSREEKHTLLD
jgi:hypothetical protein